MCLTKKPKPPPVPAEDPGLKRQIAAGLADERTRRTEAKKLRFEDTLQQLGMGFGRRSLLTGSRGGAGFAAAARSLMVTR